MKLLIHFLFFLLITGCTPNSKEYEKKTLETYRQLFELAKQEKNIERVYEFHNVDEYYYKKKTSKPLIDRPIHISEMQSVWDKTEITSKEKENYYNENRLELYKNRAYFKIQQPILNKLQDEAKVNVTYRCGMYCSYRETLIYKYKDQHWSLDTIQMGAKW